MNSVFPPFEPEKNGDRRPRQRPLSFGRGQVPVRVIIPSIFTLLGLCAGLTAIRMAIEHRFDIAIAAVVLAAVLDGLDGRIARLLKATSRFGAELDSLADFVNFGVAPGIIVFTWALGPLRSLGWIVVLVFALCAALRLARFNVALDKPRDAEWEGNYFVGMPAPAGAIVLLLPLYIDGLDVPYVASLTPIILVYTLTISFLMVSQVPTFSGKLIGQRIAREYVPPVIVAAALFVAVLLTYPFTTLTLGTLAYLTAVPISAYRFRRLRTRNGDDARQKDASTASSGNGRPDPDAGSTPRKSSETQPERD